MVDQIKSNSVCMKGFIAYSSSFKVFSNPSKITATNKFKTIILKNN